MVVVNTTSKRTEGGTGQTGDSKSAPTAGLIPFTKASNLHEGTIAYSGIATLPSGSLPLMTIPSFGYLRSIMLKVNLTTTGGNPSFLADGPFGVFSQVTLKEPNGNPIVSLSGYELYLANKYGGYRTLNDPKQWNGYNETATNATFWIRIPVELRVRDALAALPNQNNAAPFSVQFDLNTIAGIYSSVTPPTSVLVTVSDVWAEQWDQPGDFTANMPNQNTPPFVNTTQMWSSTNRILSAGFNEIQHTRVGNWNRTFIYVFRDSSGVRTDLMSALSTFKYDERVLTDRSATLWRQQMAEVYGYTGTLDAAGALDTGVYVHQYTNDFDGKPGFETRNLYLPTLPSTRLVLTGQSFGAGSVKIVTNDIVYPDRAAGL